MRDKADTYCGKCIKADVCGMEGVYDEATTYCAYRVTDRPHGEWIPCSERLPEEHHIYLTTIKKANGITLTTHSYFFTKEVGWSDACVIAWMPLPEPYKKEG